MVGTQDQVGRLSRVLQAAERALAPQDFAIRAAQEFAFEHRDPEWAERFLLKAMEGPDPQKTLNAYTAAVDIFSRLGNYPLAKEYAFWGRNAAQGLGDPARAEQFRQAHERSDTMFSSAEWTDPLPAGWRAQPPYRGTAESHGATHQEFMQGMGQLHSSRSPQSRALFDALNKQQDVEAVVCGTLVQDGRGRFGVRDETSGKTTLIDYSSSHMRDVLTQDLGSVVQVQGSVALWGEGKSMKAHTYYGSSHNIKPESARHGFRFADPSVLRVAHIGKATVGIGA